MKDLAYLESIPLNELREQIMDRLTEHYSRESLTMEEFERRADAANKASTQTALYVLVSDLPALPKEAAAPVQSPKRGMQSRSPQGFQISEGGSPARDTIFCLLGGAQRKGVWTAPRKMDAMCVFGGADIDLRRAIVPPEGVKINVMAVFGGVDVIIPPGMRVETRGIGIMGGFDHAQNPSADRDAPLVLIEGLAIFGGVGVRIKE